MTAVVDDKQQTDMVANTMAHALAGAVRAKQAAGAAGAADGELSAQAIIALMYPGKDGNELTQNQKETVSALSQLAACLVSGIVSDSSRGAVSGAELGKMLLKITHSMMMKNWSTKIHKELASLKYSISPME